ncbi:hypothetical protein ACLOJK_037454, partial [Asimina triloba]
ASCLKESANKFFMTRGNKASKELSLRPDVAAMDDPPIAPKQKPRWKYSQPTRGIQTRSTARRANTEDPAS